MVATLRTFCRSEDQTRSDQQHVTRQGVLVAEADKGRGLGEGGEGARKSAQHGELE